MIGRLPKMLNCRFCQKECKNENSLRNHERLCKENVNRQQSAFMNADFNKNRKKRSNQYIKAIELGLEKPIVSDEVKSLLSKKMKSLWTSEKRKQWSDKMKVQASLNVENHPESYSYKNFCGRAKKELYNEEWMHSSWETIFAKWCDENEIKWTKRVPYFRYVWEGTERKYFPDFYLKELDLYVEVKGYETDRDTVKWSVVNNLIIVKQKEINEIKSGIYRLIGKPEDSYSFIPGSSPGRSTKHK